MSTMVFPIINKKCKTQVMWLVWDQFQIVHLGHLYSLVCFLIKSWLQIHHPGMSSREYQAYQPSGWNRLGRDSRPGRVLWATMLGRFLIKQGLKRQPVSLILVSRFSLVPASGQLLFSWRLYKAHFLTGFGSHYKCESGPLRIESLSVKVGYVIYPWANACPGYLECRGYGKVIHVEVVPSPLEPTQSRRLRTRTPNIWS